MIYRCNFCGNLFNRRLNNSNIFEQLMCPKCIKKTKKSEISLGIGILHYQESDETILHVLKTIDNQKKINFSNLKILVATDGKGIKLNEQYLNNNIKNFIPEYIYNTEHTYAGGTRNLILKNLKTDYIMFIDGDDELYGKKSLSKSYKILNKYKPELYCSVILEEQSDGRCLKYKNLKSIPMCHGKIYKRDFLLNNNISFNDKILVSEDARFNLSILSICNNIIFDPKNISYKWNFNKDSITRNIDQKTNNLDSYFRCFDAILSELENWYFNISKENIFVDDKVVSFLYNILYYRVQVEKFKDKNLKDFYLKKYFEHVNYKHLDFNITDSAGKTINKHLLKNIMLFSDAYKKYK